MNTSKAYKPERKKNNVKKTAFSVKSCHYTKYCFQGKKMKQASSAEGEGYDPRGLFLETPEKPFVKLRSAYSVKLVFSYIVKGIRFKITAKFPA